MNKHDRHNCPYCDTEIVYKDEMGNFWAMQHGIADCMGIIKKKKDEYRDALEETQEQLAECNEELFVARQMIRELKAVRYNGLPEAVTGSGFSVFLKEALGKPWPGDPLRPSSITDKEESQ